MAMDGSPRPVEWLGTPTLPFRIGRNAIWLLLLALAELADIATTRFGIGHGTFEANPLSAWLLDRGLLEMVKIAAVAAMALVASLAVRFARRAEVARAVSVRSWSLRGVQLSVWALTAGTVTNLGMWALESMSTR